jgi:hypothetical protein
MSYAGQSFELGGVVVPLTAALGLQQAIAPIDGGSTRLRAMNGAAIPQFQWRRLGVQLSGDGYAPLGLSALDYDSPSGLTLKCGLPRAVRSNSASIALPIARRTDTGYLPFARAHMADGSERETTISITSHTATLGTVTGAISYAVWYFPQLTVLASPPEETFDGESGTASWSMTLEEV